MNCEYVGTRSCSGPCKPDDPIPLPMGSSPNRVPRPSDRHGVAMRMEPFPSRTVCDPDHMLDSSGRVLCASNHLSGGKVHGDVSLVTHRLRTNGVGIQRDLGKAGNHHGPDCERSTQPDRLGQSPVEPPLRSADGGGMRPCCRCSATAPAGVERITGSARIVSSAS